MCADNDSPRPLAARRILIVDDQPSIRGVLELALSRAGADVWTAQDGAIALELVRESPPELILLDLVMPGLNGWGVIEELSRDARTRQIPVVLQTSIADYASFDRARKQGVAAFISKPFRVPEVIETCRRIFEGARPLQGKGVALDENRVPVQVCDANGALLTVGELVDVGPSGGQIEGDAPLSLGHLLKLTYLGPEGLVTSEAKVRWVTQLGNRYHAGVSFRT